MQQNIDQRLRQARLLVVDDTAETTLLVGSMLKDAGFENVHSTNDPCEVLELYRRLQPDLIMLDLLMPVLDGFQVMAGLKPLLPKGGFLPILVLTADTTPATKHRALETGASDFLTKPFDHVEVALRIDNLLRIRFLHVDLARHNYLLERQKQMLDEKMSEIATRRRETDVALEALRNTEERLKHALKMPLRSM